MLTSEVQNFDDRSKFNISYFDDDTIDTVRNHIGSVMNVHPDRLFVLVKLKLPHDYYQKDPRRWERLFDRLSYNGAPLNQVPFKEYQLVYRSPQTNAVFQDYTRAEWILKPSTLEDLHSPTREFTEYRIFGTDEDRSYILPLDFTSSLVSKIPSAQNPDILKNTLVKSLYDVKHIEAFIAVPYSEEKAQNVKNVYYPLLTERTPNTMSEESVALLNKNTDLLKKLLELKVYEPKQVSITRARIYVDLVDTDFGDAVRTRFEQIFYGLTMSEDVPYVGFFTSKSEVMRHKFYKPDPKKDEPSLKMNMWSRWRMTVPSRNQPTLLFYKGTSRENFDRIAITDTDITITFYRDDKSGIDTLNEMKKDGIQWLKSLDAVMAFVENDDIQSDRWKIHEIDFIANYVRPLETPDIRRFDCISFIFNHIKRDEARFGLLRTDREIYNITAEEVKLVQMEIENRLTVPEVMSEFNVSETNANKLIQGILLRLEDEPNLLRRKFRGFPLIQVRTNDIKVTSVTDIDHALKYSNILRFVLGESDSVLLNKICPKRVEAIPSQVGIAPVEEFESPSIVGDEFADIFGDIPTDEGVPIEEPVVQTTPSTRISTETRQATKYGYLLNRLVSFDPNTFVSESKETQYAKKCNQEQQPIILNSKELDDLSGTPYDPRSYLDEKKMMPFTSEKYPSEEGLVICPEYWCIVDQIPLTESQLVKENGELTCPICGRKVRTSKNVDIREYSVEKRDPNIVYPGFTKHVSPLTKKPMPCCYTKPRTDKKEVEDGKYYVVSETKVNLNEFRFAFLSKSLIESLNLGETYKLFKDSPRFQSGVSGYFRIGLGRASKNLPVFLNLKTQVSPPRESIETVLKCSFLRTWKTLGDSHLNEIETKLKSIPPYDTDEYVRENIAKIISGIDEAFEAGTMNALEDLEYSALFLQCDVFRVFMPSNTVGCMFYSPMIRPRSRGIVVLQNQGNIDILSRATRLSRGFEYKSNVFAEPFAKETFVTLEKARNQSCSTDVPTFSKALNILQDILSASGQPDFEVILDPFGRAQAFFIPGHMILPFQPSPVPEMTQTKLMGYERVETEKLPRYEKVMEYLTIAKKYANGYEAVEDIFNHNGERVEVLLKSGLRVPVYPERGEGTEALEVIQTVNELGEGVMVYDGHSLEIEKGFKEISYASEVYEFLLYELTHDLNEKFPELRASLLEDHPSRKRVEPLLRKWFEETVDFVKLSTPIEFISKVREPCGQFKSKDSCNGNLCGWNGKTCNVQVRNTIRKEPLFHRLLSALVDNVKIRAMVLDGRTSPFFSTILYMQLPTELIYTDEEVNVLLMNA